jgi:RNA polymerase sigma-70 factor (ECF subfamily)
MELNSLNDRHLVALYTQGDERALGILIARHQQKIFGYIISKIKDEDIANDIFQDVFVKVIQTVKSGRYNEEGKFIQWVMRISHNLVIDHFRREKRYPTLRPTDEFNVFDIIHDGERNAEESQVYSQIIDDARRLIEHLPDEQREVVRLRLEMGMSFKDIAERTDVSINTALGRMRYALINIRKMMEKAGVNLQEK